MASWLELVKTEFTIVTGDGQRYTPNWFNANVSVEYNVAQFNFRNLAGTLVERSQPMGAVYNLELVFQGKEHVTIATAFRKSAADRRPWTIKHPLYGQLLVQPISGLGFDNADNRANTTKITGPVMETIGKAQVNTTVSAPDAITAAKVITDQHYAADFVNAVPAPGVKDISAMKDIVNKFYKIIGKINSVDTAIINAKNTTLTNINKLGGAISDTARSVAATTDAVNSIQQFLSLPATIPEGVAQRMRYLIAEFNSLALNIFNTGPNLKRQYQTFGGTCISAMCQASVYNISETDYAYSGNVLSVISSIVANYNSYLESLDGMQTVNGGELDSYIPDVTSLAALDNLVNYTVSSLFTIAINAKQQRTLTLTKDNNWINIAKQIYGLLPDDSTITTVMQDNNAGLNTMLQVRKGTKIIYYV